MTDWDEERSLSEENEGSDRGRERRVVRVERAVVRVEWRERTRGVRPSSGTVGVKERRWSVVSGCCRALKD